MIYKQNLNGGSEVIRLEDSEVSSSKFGWRRKRKREETHFERKYISNNELAYATQSGYTKFRKKKDFCKKYYQRQKVLFHSDKRENSSEKQK